MKKILAIFMAVSMLLTFTACSKGTDSPSSAEATAAPTGVPLTASVEINDDGNVECKVVETYGYNDFLFVFNGKKLSKVECVYKVIGDHELYQIVHTKLEEVSAYFDTLEFDETNQSVNCVYSKRGMEACSFTNKTPEELKTYLESYSADNTIGLSAAVAGDIVNATEAP